MAEVERIVGTVVEVAEEELRVDLEGGGQRTVSLLGVDSGVNVPPVRQLIWVYIEEADGKLASWRYPPPLSNGTDGLSMLMLLFLGMFTRGGTRHERRTDFTPRPAAQTPLAPSPKPAPPVVSAPVPKPAPTPQPAPKPAPAPNPLRMVELPRATVMGRPIPASAPSAPAGRQKLVNVVKPAKAGDRNGFYPCEVVSFKGINMTVKLDSDGRSETFKLPLQHHLLDIGEKVKGNKVFLTTRNGMVVKWRDN